VPWLAAGGDRKKSPKPDLEPEKPWAVAAELLRDNGPAPASRSA